MDFRTYRKEQGWTLRDAAQFLSTDGIRFTESLVRKHETGFNLPRPDAIERYERLTGGRVTGNDFIAAKRAFDARQRQAEQVELAAAPT